MRRGRVIAAAAVASILAGVVPAASAQAERSSPAGQATPAQARAEGEGSAEWTVMVYMAADNNLEATALIDLQEMAEAAGPNVNFLVLVDRMAKDQGYPPEIPDGDVLGIPNFGDAKLLKLNADGVEILQELGELDTMDPQNLAWFVWYGLTEYPAERTGLIFWNHGGAALIPFGEDAESAPGDFFSLPEIQQALGSALSEAEADRLDFIGYDACLNATLEIARSMAPYAEVMTASQEIEAGHGWDWTSFSVLQQDGATGRDLANAVVDSYEAHSQELPLGGESDYTQSAIDLDAIAKVDDALEGFVNALEDDPTSGLALLQARQGAIEFGVVGSDPTANFNQVDLVDLLARLPETLPDDVLVARNALADSVGKAVFNSVSGPAHAGASGLAIHLPPSGQGYSKLYEDHDDPTGWRTLLQSILEGASTPPGTDSPSVSGDLELEVDDTGWQATMNLAEGSGATLAGGAGIYGVPGDDGSVLALAVLPASLGAGGADAIQTSWSYQFVRLNGEPVTAQIDPLEQGFRASVGGVYVDAAGTQVGATLRMDLEVDGGSLTIGDVKLLGSSAGGVSEIYPTEGSQFAPSRLTLSGAEIVDDELLDPFDPLDFQVGVDELASGDRFAASLIAYLPDGSAAARTGQATRP